MRYYGRGLRPKTVSNNHGGLTSFSDCATRSIGDYHEAILDEVAIEGLDGVTLEALWTRLKLRPDFGFSLDTEPEKSWVLSILIQQAKQSYTEDFPDILFYLLPNARAQLVIYNRFEHTDGELGVVVEPDNLPEDPYIFKAFEDKEREIKGSCDYFSSRTDITESIIKLLDDVTPSQDITVDDFVKSVSKEKITLENSPKDNILSHLVVVASQKLRNKAILGKYYDPLLYDELSSIQWSLLERIGRARYLGEATQGKGSLSNATKIPPKTLHYHLKEPERMGLICKQPIYQRIRGMNAHGSVYSLPRFHIQRKSKPMMLTYKVIKLLKTKPHCMALYPEVIEALSLTQQAIKKLYKHTLFKNNIRSDVRVPHRFLYPNANEQEWKTAHGEERQYRVMELIKKDMDPEEFWSQDRIDDAEHDGGNEYDEGILDGPLRTVPYDKSRIVIERSMAWQSYRLLEESGPSGLTQLELGIKLGVPKLEARSIYRYLQRSGLTIQYTLDQGRQRSYKLVAKKFEGNIAATDQLELEKTKMHELKLKKEEPDESKTQLQPNINDSGDKSLEVASPSTSSGGIQSSSDNCKISFVPFSSLVEDSNSSEVQEAQPNITQTEAKFQIEIDTNIASKYNITPPKNSGKKRGRQTDNMGREWPSQGKKSKLSFPQDVIDPHIPLSQQSVRRIRRENTILEAVRSSKVIVDPSSLHKLIIDQERKEGGHDGSMDRKSLHRILAKLATEGQIKTINVKLTHPDSKKEKVMTFVCEPDVSDQHTIIQSAVDQAKMKFNIVPKDRDNLQKPKRETKSKGDSPSKHKPNLGSQYVEPGGKNIVEELPPQKTENDTPVISTKYDKRQGRKYGLQPKFIRMRELHLLLFYLCRNFTGQKLTQKEKSTLISDLKSQDDSVMTTEVEAEIASFDIYQGQICWTMFISPLPSHQGWDDGWCLICDVLLRLPLSLFLMLVNVSFVIEGLQEYIEHPIRRHYLICQLPTKIANQLLHRRKYIFSIHEIATRLAFIGIVQFGPQKFKEKDQVFVYVNQNTSLLNTTTSATGYHQVEDKEYDSTSYHLKNLDDVAKYWYDMYEICIYTPLNQAVNSGLVGQEVTLENMEKKPAMLQTLTPRENEEAKQADIGVIPGDHLGPAGLDSSAFAYLKRNWTWNSKFQPIPSSSTPILDSSTGSKSIHSNRISSKKLNDDEIVKVSIVPNVKRSQKGQKRKRSLSVSGQEGRKKVNSSEFAVGNKPRPKVRKRILQQRISSKPRKPYYDDKDRAALRLMTKLRVEWTEKEDSFLLLCKVAGAFISSNLRQYQHINYTLVRNLLHKRFPEGLNKTSRACQRRTNYMMKNQATISNVSLFLADLEQDDNINVKFTLEWKKLFLKEENEDKQGEMFEKMVDVVVAKYKNTSGVEGCNSAPKLPESLNELYKNYNLIYPSSTIKDLHHFEEPASGDDIQKSVIRSVILSSLYSASDKSNWAFQLFKIYQQYPDAMLRAVMSNLRSKKLVSIKKQYNRKACKAGNYLPLSSSPYQLSVSFTHNFLNRYNYDIFEQSWVMVRNLLAKKVNCGGGDEILINEEGGYAAAIVGLMAENRISFRIEVPEQLIVLDPNLAAVDEAYVRILQRYKSLLRNANNMEEEDMQIMDADDQTSTNKIQSLDTKTKASKSLHKGVTVRNLETIRKEVAVSMDGLSATEFPNKNNSNERSQLLAQSCDISADKSDNELALPQVDSSHAEPFTEGIVFSGLDDNNDEERSNLMVAKSASRIALYMMREEMKEGVGNKDIDTIDDTLLSNAQHSQDYFVISSCRIHAEILPSTYGKMNINETVKVGQKGPGWNGKTEILVPSNLLPTDPKCVKQVLNRYGLNMNGMFSQTTDKLKRTCLPREIMSLDDLLEESKDIGEHDKELANDLKSVYNFIATAGSLGIKGKELKRIELCSTRPLPFILEVLMNYSLIIRTGIVNSRFVVSKKANPWLLHSFKLPRSMKDNTPNIKHAGKLLNFNATDESQVGQHVCSNCEIFKTANPWNLRQHQNNCKNTEQKNELTAVSTSDASSHSESHEDLGIHYKSSKRAPMKSSTKVSDAADNLDWDKVSSIRPFYCILVMGSKRIIENHRV